MLYGWRWKVQGSSSPLAVAQRLTKWRRKYAAGGRVETVAADVRSVEDCARLVAETVATFGRLDIRVNNAGTSAGGTFEAATDEAWQADFDLKLFAAIRLARLGIPHMKRNGWGRIVNVTNIAAKQPAARTMPTSVTRVAGLGFTKALSEEYAPDNILVNTVCIGFVRAKPAPHQGGPARDSA